MQVEFKKESINVSEMGRGETRSLLLESDVIVPDVNPDIEEILQTEATAYISEEGYVGGNYRVAGSVQVKILYLPQGSFMPKCITSKIPFQETLHISETEGQTVCVKVDTEHVESSLIHSRKLNVKVVVSLLARNHFCRQVALLVGADEKYPLKIRQKKVEAYQIKADKTCEFVISESIEVPSAKPDIREILKTDIKANKGECKVMDGKILLRGALLLHTLYTQSDEASDIEVMEHEIPFTEVIELAGVEEDSLCHVSYSVKDAYLSVREDENRDARAVSVDVVVRAHVLASSTNTFSVIDDCYSLRGSTECLKEIVLANELLSEGTSHETIKEMICFLEEGMIPHAVYSVTTRPQIQEVSLKNGELSISGRVVAFVLYGLSEGAYPMYSRVEEFPFCHTIPVAGISDDAYAEAYITDTAVSFSLNAAGEIELRCVIELFSRVTRTIEIEALSACELEETEQEAKGGLIIYFVRAGDTLWDIAKYYKTDGEKIMELNQLEKELLHAGQKLLIPRA